MLESRRTTNQFLCNFSLLFKSSSWNLPSTIFQHQRFKWRLWIKQMLILCLLFMLFFDVMKLYTTQLMWEIFHQNQVEGFKNKVEVNIASRPSPIIWCHAKNGQCSASPAWKWVSTTITRLSKELGLIKFKTTSVLSWPGSLYYLWGYNCCSCCAPIAPRPAHWAWLMKHQCRCHWNLIRDVNFWF